MGRGFPAVMAEGLAEVLGGGLNAQFGGGIKQSGDSKSAVDGESGDGVGEAVGLDLQQVVGGGSGLIQIAQDAPDGGASGGGEQDVNAGDRLQQDLVRGLVDGVGFAVEGFQRVVGSVVFGIPVLRGAGGNSQRRGQREGF